MQIALFKEPHVVIGAGMEAPSPWHFVCAAIIICEIFHRNIVCWYSNILIKSLQLRHVFLAHCLEQSRTSPEKACARWAPTDKTEYVPNTHADKRLLQILRTKSTKTPARGDALGSCKTAQALDDAVRLPTKLPTELCSR